MDNTVYREMEAGEEEAVVALVEDVFNAYVAQDYGPEGVAEFFRYANADAMKERTRAGGFVLVAEQCGNLVGILEFSPPDCIAMLFVSIHRRGIAKGLLAHAVEKALESDPCLTKLTVHSSPYAEFIYGRMGFRRSGRTVNENSIKYVPMEIAISVDST